MSFGSYASAGAPPGVPHRPNRAALHASFADADGDDIDTATEDELETEAFFENTPPRGGPVTSTPPGMPAMPSMGTEPTMQTILDDPTQHMLGIPNERVGWEFTEVLMNTATGLLKDFKKVPAKDQVKFDDKNPMAEFNWLLPLIPMEPPERGGVIHKVTVEDLGRLATIFVPRDFAEADKTTMKMILDGVRTSASPLKRIASALKHYGVEMSGLPGFKLGIMVMALSYVKDRRVASTATASGSGGPPGMAASTPR